MKPTVLIVDDQPGTRRFLSRILESAGYGVIEAEDKQTACDAVSSQARGVSLALVDVELAELGGREVAESLQARSQMRVVFMSGYEREMLVADGRLPTNAQFVSKPFTIQRVLEVVEGALVARVGSMVTSPGRLL